MLLYKYSIGKHLYIWPLDVIVRCNISIVLRLLPVHINILSVPNFVHNTYTKGVYIVILMIIVLLSSSE